MVSKVLQELEDSSWGYRDRIRHYYRSKHKLKLSEKDMEIIQRAEQVQEILLANRNDMKVAKEIIAEKLSLVHRSQVDRAIEDAHFLFGAMFTQNKNHQRMLQLADIEWGIKVAKEQGDVFALDTMLKRREKLFQLDQADADEQEDTFSKIELHYHFLPDNFKDRLPEDYQKRVEAIKNKAMHSAGLITEAPDAEFIPAT